MRDRSRLRVLAALALVGGLATPAAAQRRASEEGSVAQTVDGTTITIKYHRPVARGRERLFGGVVHWGEKWTPGANWATTLEVSKDVQLNGRPIPKGTYSLWMVPREQGEWTVIVHTKARAFHTQRPDTAGELVRFGVAPLTGAHMETLAFYFPVVSPDGARLHMHWGTTVIPLDLKVTPSRERAATLAARDAVAYVGSYEEIPDSAAIARAAARTPPDTVKRARSEIVVRDGRAIMRMNFEGEWFESELTPVGEHRFRMSMLQGGQAVEDFEGTLVFLTTSGRTTGYEMRGDNGTVWTRARKLR